MSKSQYVAMFERGIKGANYFMFAHLEHPDGTVPPPFIAIHGVKYVLADDQTAIARAFRTSQQNVSRWMKNEAPE